MQSQLVPVIFGSFVVCWAAAVAQNTSQSAEAPATPTVIKDAKEIGFKHSSFRFARVKYSAAGRRGGWMTDYPDADLGFTAQFQKVTGLPCNSDPAVVELTDPALKQYPFIYLVEGGLMKLTDPEIAALRKYLLEGGFLMLDDFWGDEEWQTVAAEFAKIFPNRGIVDLPLEHEVFRSFYRITEKPQVPSIGHALQRVGVTSERQDAKEARYRGITDDKERLMVIFCHNTDLGDGWERANENEYYAREFSFKKAYPMGINIVVYALTH